MRARLINEISFEAGIQPPTPQITTVEVKPVEAKEAVEKPRGPTITLQLLAKYPILPEMSKFISNIRLSDMPREVFDRAYERIVEALEHGEIKRSTENYYIEVLSYPMTVMVLTALNNEWIKRR